MKVNFMHKFFILVCSMLVFSYGNDCGCDLPDLTLSLAVDGTVYYNSSEEIGGYQFDVLGANVTGTFGGDTQTNGFTSQAGGNTVIAFVQDPDGYKVELIQIDPPESEA